MVSELALDQETLARHTLRAELAGEVIDVAIKPGELAAVGTPAITLADTTHPYADVFVPEGELAQVRTGAPVTCHVDSARLGFSGVVEYVYPDTEFTPKFLFSDRERPQFWSCAPGCGSLIPTGVFTQKYPRSSSFGDDGERPAPSHSC